MKKLNKKNWRKLDNTAKKFSLDDKRNTSTFRFSAILKTNVEPSILQKALNKTLNDCPSFKMKMGAGLFWNYLELNEKKIIVQEENEIPCEHINFKKNNGYLFKVTYYKNKINLDVFHVLTDGTGASILLKYIIYNYLIIKYKLPDDIKYESEINNFQDQYLKYYDPKLKELGKSKKVYQLPGIPNNKINNTYHYIVSVKELKQICKKYNATITEYITAVHIYSIYNSIYNKKSKKEIVVGVPINLRKIFNEESNANFFTYMKINSNVVGKEKVTFNDVLEYTKGEFYVKLTNDKIKEYISRDMKIGMNLPIRLAPLFVKKLFIRFLGFSVNRVITTNMSNMGSIEIEDKYKKYIDNVIALVMPNKEQKIKCTVCSYQDKLSITLNTNINDKEYHKVFLKQLRTNLKKIEVISNNE